MILDDRLRATVIAIDEALGILELGWHGLALDRAIQVAESRLHVGYRFTTYGASERTFRVF